MQHPSAESSAAALHLDLRCVPFSRFGSYVALALRHYGPADSRRERLLFRSIHGDAGQREIFYLETVLADAPIEFTVSATPTLMRIRAANGGQIEVCFPEPGLLRLRGRGVSLRFEFIGGPYARASLRAHEGVKRWQLDSASNNIRYMFTPVAGLVNGQSRLGSGQNGEPDHHGISITLSPPAGGEWFDVAVEEFFSECPARDFAGFDLDRQRVEAEFNAWLDRVPTAPPRYQAARRLAAYVNWSAVVAPLGHFKRPAMLMSKNVMCNLWSWDHCFNAMAHAAGDPQLAFDQWMIPFDHQDVSGGLPDFVNDRLQHWICVKPPVHGLALRHLLRSAPGFYTTDRLEQVYDRLARFTEWWFRTRDDDRDGVPQYYHGTDSGWDNATPFAAGTPLEGPDLSSYLVVQMDVLADVAERLNRADEAERWRSRAESLAQRLVPHFWRDGKFRTTIDGTHEYTSDEQSLFNYLPILIADRLPRDVVEQMLADLKAPGHLLTEFGLATESPASQHYRPDGYWRGPIWAPAMYLIVEGLHAAGESDFANDLARRFCDLCARSGFAENFDSSTGQPLRDKAYTWTSSVFLLFASQPLLANT